ncbi:hypothetical protein [Streptomyces sp. NPDC059349]|uniref:hypothetical protein n=1 Tax=Streptomyces sp. NPDC059349 TaxID=3346808 RepID=UPI00369664B5
MVQGEHQRAGRLAARPVREQLPPHTVAEFQLDARPGTLARLTLRAPQQPAAVGGRGARAGQQEAAGLRARPRPDVLGQHMDDRDGHRAAPPGEPAPGAAVAPVVGVQIGEDEDQMPAVGAAGDLAAGAVLLPRTVRTSRKAPEQCRVSARRCAVCDHSRIESPESTRSVTVSQRSWSGSSWGSHMPVSACSSAVASSFRKTWPREAMRRFSGSEPTGDVPPHDSREVPPPCQ